MNTLKLGYPIPQELLTKSLQESISQQVIDIVSIDCGKKIVIDDVVFHMLENTHGDMTIRNKSTKVAMSLGQDYEFVFFLSLIKGAEALGQLEEVFFPEGKESLLSWMGVRDKKKHTYTKSDFGKKGMYEDIPKWGDISTMSFNKGSHWNHDLYEVHVDTEKQEIIFSFWGEGNVGFLNVETPKEKICISIREVRAYVQALFISAEKGLGRTSSGKYRGVLECLFSEEFGKEMEFFRKPLRRF